MFYANNGGATCLLTLRFTRICNTLDFHQVIMMNLKKFMFMSQFQTSIWQHRSYVIS